jgi:hypothetical protein
MEIDREAKLDIGIVVLMVLYGIAIVGSSPLLAVAAWILSGLLILRHTVDPFGEFVEEHQFLFLLVMLAILTIGFLLS